MAPLVVLAAVLRRGRRLSDLSPLKGSADCSDIETWASSIKRHGTNIAFLWSPRATVWSARPRYRMFRETHSYPGPAGSVHTSGFHPTIHSYSSLSVVCFSKPPSTFFPLDSTWHPHLFNPPSPPFLILSPISGLSNSIRTYLLILFVVMPVFSPISLSTITIHLIPVFLRVLTGAVMETMSHQCISISVDDCRSGQTPSLLTIKSRNEMP